jgi:hypothetical protein
MTEATPAIPQDRSDLVQIGASARSREVLDQLQEHGHISDLMDGYRLAIAVAIGFGRTPRVGVRGDRKTMFAVGNLDPDSAIREAIVEIYPAARATPSRAAEDLAEQGLEIISESFEGEDISLAELLARVRKANRSETSG